MVSAYLRGLLKKDYPQGNQSLIRETIILHALRKEDEIRLLENEWQAEAALAGKPIQGAQREQFNRMPQTLNAKLMYLESITPKRVEQIKKLYTVLEESGILDVDDDDDFLAPLQARTEDDIL